MLQFMVDLVKCIHSLSFYEVFYKFNPVKLICFVVVVILVVSYLMYSTFRDYIQLKVSVKRFNVSKCPGVRDSQNF